MTRLPKDRWDPNSLEDAIDDAFADLGDTVRPVGNYLALLNDDPLEVARLLLAPLGMTPEDLQEEE